MSATAMHIDAILLIVITLAMIVNVSDDDFFHPFLPRLLGSAGALFAFGQAMWLLGVWVPGASGFPIPRIGFDAMVAAVAVYRAVVVVREHARRSARPLRHP